MSKIALIDSGTNTFSLIVYELQDNRLVKICKESVYVYLAEQGFGIISENAAKRALDAFRKFKKIIEVQKADKVIAVGTAAWRMAKNSELLCSDIFEETGISVEIISGEEEAELIFAGVAQTLPEDGENFLLIDVGGGSVEFMIGEKRQLKWCQSFALGGALLFNSFNVSDPISKRDMEVIKSHIITELEPLKRALGIYPAERLAAASGTLDALASILGIKNTDGGLTPIEGTDFESVYENIIKTDLEQRLEMPGMIASRAKLLPVAMTLLKTVIEELQISFPIYFSDYALHEGLLELKMKNLEN